MTNLTGDGFLIPKTPGAKTLPFRMAGYTNFGGGNTEYTIYKYAFVFCDVSDTDGYVRDMDSGVTVATGDVFTGIAAERQSITSTNTADGAKLISCYVDGIWGAPKGGVAITDLGATLFADDDNVVTTTSTGNLAIGKVVDVDSTYVWFDISDYAGKPSAETT